MERNGGPEKPTRPLPSPWGYGDRKVRNIASPPLKTSRQESRRRSDTPTSRPKTPSPPTPIPCFPIEHIAQSLTAQGTAESLRRELRRDDEHLVETRPPAHPHRKILGNCGWALALALGWTRFRLDRGNRAFGQNNQRNPPPIPLTLLAAMNLTLIAATPRATRLTTTPAPCRQPARLTAIATLWLGGLKILFAPFEQAVPTTQWPRRCCSL